MIFVLLGILIMFDGSLIITQLLDSMLDDVPDDKEPTEEIE